MVNSPDRFALNFMRFASDFTGLLLLLVHSQPLLNMRRGPISVGISRFFMRFLIFKDEFDKTRHLAAQNCSLEGGVLLMLRFFGGGRFANRGVS